jgi:glutaredoxin 3
MITIYTTNTCAYCKMVKQYLTQKGKEFKIINLDDEPEKQAEAFALSGALTVPVTTDGSSVVIGYNPC